jgi:glycerol kinase
LTAFSTKQHIIRAALEAICFQTRDILEAMNKDCGIPLTKLNVDGRLTRNDLLMQLQADISGIPVVRAQSQDITALGVAIAAGQAEGINVWDWDAVDREVIPSDTFLPTTTEDERDARYTKWKMAVQRSLGWAVPKKTLTMTGKQISQQIVTRGRNKLTFRHQDDCHPENKSQKTTTATLARNFDLFLNRRKV